jgi:hypothetical protein
MKKLILLAGILAFGAIGTAQAGPRVEMKGAENAIQAADMHARYDHPKTQVMKNEDLKIEVTTDAIMHSCCMPPNLVVAGKITNVSPKPVDYVHLNFAFEDKAGKILHAETLYNHKAESMEDDATVQKILNEKPHFEPIKPGDTDTFAFSIPCNMLPEFDKVELYSNNAKD